jgi:hypothetical protein
MWDLDCLEEMRTLEFTFVFPQLNTNLYIHHTTSHHITSHHITSHHTTQSLFCLFLIFLSFSNFKCHFDDFVCVLSERDGLDFLERNMTFSKTLMKLSHLSMMEPTQLCAVIRIPNLT